MASLLDDLLNLLVEPLGGLDSIAGVEVAVVEGREATQLFLGFLEVNIVDHFLHGVFVFDGRGEVTSGHDASRRLVVLPVCDIKEVDVVL